MKRAIYCLSAFSLILIICLTSYKNAWSATPERAYIANFNRSNVSVIDTNSNTIITNIAVGVGPAGVAVNGAGARAYVTNYYGNSLSVLNISTNTVAATVTVGTHPWGVAVNPAGTNVYVANFSSNTVSVIDTSNNTVTATVAVGSAPREVAVNPTGTRVYVANSNSNSLSVIDTTSNTVVATVGVGSSPFGLVVNPTGTRVYTTNNLSHTVSVIDTSTNTVTATVSVGNNPYGIAINPAGTIVYTSNHTSPATVSVIDTNTNTLATTIRVDIYPFGLSVRPNGNRLYVAHYGADTVSVIDIATQTLVTTIKTGDSGGGYTSGQFITGEPVSTQATTTTTLVSSANPAILLTPIKLTATVTGNTPTGTVTFKDGSGAIGTATLSNGKATFTTSTSSTSTGALLLGSHSITAFYGGDAGNFESTSAVLTQLIIKEPSTASKAIITSPVNGATLTSTSQRFEWNLAGASEYYLRIGTSPGAEDIYSQSQGGNSFATVGNLPSTGVTLYVRLSSNIDGTWQSNDYTYKSFTDTSKGNTGNTSTTTSNNNTTPASSCKSGALYSASFLGGNSGSVCLSIKKVGTPASDSKLRGTASWKGFATTAGSADGSTFTFAWENYESNSSTGMLFENDPAHGALFVLAFAFPSSACSGGASFFAVIEMANAVSFNDLGSTLTFTPLFGQICGTKITSLTQYTLTKQ